MPKLRIFLFGVLLGVLLPLPSTLWYKTHPREEAVIVSETDYLKRVEKEFTIQNVPTWRGKVGVLHIYIYPLDKVQFLHKKLCPKSTEGSDVVGFYIAKTHTIICIDSLEVFIHELRHVFERYFHQ